MIISDRQIRTLACIRVVENQVAKSAWRQTSIFFLILTVSPCHRKTKETGEVDSDGNSIVLSDVDKEGDVDLADGMVDGDEEKPHDVKAEVEGGVVQEKPKKGRRKSRKAEASAQPNGESDAYVADAEEAAAPTQKARGRGKKSL